MNVKLPLMAKESRLAIVASSSEPCHDPDCGPATPGQSQPIDWERLIADGSERQGQQQQRRQLRRQRRQQGHLKR